MRGADVGGAEHDPSGLVVQQVQVPEDFVEPEGEVSADVLKDDQWGP